VSKKTVTEIPVEINELALSLLGWEAQDFRARVTTTQYDDGDCFHKLAVSGVFRFNDDDWVDCFRFSKEYPTHPIMVLRSPALSTLPAISELYVGDIKQGRALRMADDGYFINTRRSIDHGDLRIEVTAYDSVETSNRISCIPLQAIEIPVELVDESTPSHVRLTFDQLEAFQHRADDKGDGQHGLIRATGRVTFGTPEELLADWVSTWKDPPRAAPTVASKAPFSREAPTLVFDVLDDTGFILEQLRGGIDVDVRVDKGGRTPSRVPPWLVNLEFDPDGYSAPVGRIIARIEDS
jgi:hypothetical protein